MVLGSLMGYGDSSLTDLMKYDKFKSDDILYIGLQNLHDYQETFLKERKVNYTVQTDSFLSNEVIKQFMNHFDHLLIHFDIDVLDEAFFHSTYFANQDLVGYGSSGGKMTIEKLSSLLKEITDCADVVGFTIAEYLPFDAYKLYQLFSKIKLFTE